MSPGICSGHASSNFLEMKSSRHSRSRKIRSLRRSSRTFLAVVINSIHHHGVMRELRIRRGELDWKRIENDLSNY